VDAMSALLTWRIRVVVERDPWPARLAPRCYRPGLEGRRETLVRQRPASARRRGRARTDSTLTAEWGQATAATRGQATDSAAPAYSPRGCRAILDTCEQRRTSG